MEEAKMEVRELGGRPDWWLSKTGYSFRIASNTVIIAVEYLALTTVYRIGGELWRISQGWQRSISQ